MSMKINHELPLPEVLKNEYPLSDELKAVKQARDEEIRRMWKDPTTAMKRSHHGRGRLMIKAL